MRRNGGKMETFKLFIRSMKVMGKRLPIYLGAIFFMSVSFSTFSIMSSLLMKSVVDIAQTGEYQKLAVTIASIVSAGVVALLIYRYATITYNVEAKRVYGHLAEAVLETEMGLPYAYYEKHHSGEIISKVSYDLERMGAIYGSRFRRVIMPFMQVVMFLIPMIKMSPHLTGCLVAVNLVVLIIDVLMVEPMHRVSGELSHINGRMASRLSDLLQGMEQVRMYGAGRKTVDAFRSENEKLASRSGRKIFLSACLESVDRGFDLLCSLVFLMLGVYFVKRGYTTLGSLAAIYTMYGAFSFQFLQMGKYIPELIGCLANAQNIFDFLDEEREPENWYKNVEDKACAEAVRAVKNEAVSNREAEKLNICDNSTDTAIEIDRVCFSYDNNIIKADAEADKENGDKTVLNDFSLSVKKGECVAITGPSGCGKTTLSKLLLNLYPIDGGDIRLNGRGIRDNSIESLRQQIAYVPQEPYLFQGSIRENILMGRPDADEKEVEEAARLANAHDFILGLEKGYDTYVGERGNNLSGGQRQRIAIARAILKNAPIILLDEATSALDNESEQLVNNALKNLQGTRTILMIAHRPSTIMLADRVCGMGQL